MALITDPDNLNQGTEVILDTTNKTIRLLAAGNLSNDGVNLSTLYSFTEEEWKDDALYDTYNLVYDTVSELIVTKQSNI